MATCLRLIRDLKTQQRWIGFTDIQVDQGGKADPLLVEVAPLQKGVMKPFKKESDMQHVFGDGLFRIDRQKGRYPVAHQPVMRYT